MSFLYYIFNKNRDTLNNIDIQDNINIMVTRPKLNTLHNIMWTLFSFGRFREYRIVSQDNHVLSKAQVMPKIFIFSFMKPSGIHIGPCFTDKESRGKGLYPFLLTRIILDYKKVDDFYIFCDQGNTPSIKGIEKVGFKLFAKGAKKNHIYVIESNI